MQETSSVTLRDHCHMGLAIWFPGNAINISCISDVIVQMLLRT